MININRSFAMGFKIIPLFPNKQTTNIEKDNLIKPHIDTTYLHISHNTATAILTA